MGDAKVHPEPLTIQTEISLILEEDEEDGLKGKEINAAPEVEHLAVEGHECDEKCRKRYPLHWAAREPDFLTLKHLFANRAELDLTEVDCDGATVLIRIAGHEEWPEAAEELIELFFELATARKQLGNVEAIREFLDKQMINGYKQSALHCVASAHKPILVEYLLNAGADATLRDCDGDTPAHQVAQDREHEAYLCAQLLLDAMPNKDLLNNESRSPLELAMYHGTSVEMVQLCLDKGCSPCPSLIDPNTVQETKRLILHVAMDTVYDEYEDNVECIKTFVSRLTKEEINAKYTGSAVGDAGMEKWIGRTALHLACLNLNPNVLSCLLEHDHIDPFAVDDNGRSALHLVADFGYTTQTSGFVDLLLKNKHFTDKERDKLFNLRDSAGETALDITIRRDSTALSRAILLNHPGYPEDWMDKELFERIYYKVPEIMLPLLDKSICFENKNYEANDETFVASVAPITGFDNNPYSTDEDKYPEELSLETDFLAIFLDSPYVTEDEMEHVLDHPVVQIFIMEKWKKLRALFWIGTIVKMMWILLYMTFVIDVFWISFPSSTLDKLAEGANYLTPPQYFGGILMISSTVIIYVFKVALSIVTVGWRKMITGIGLAHLIFTASTFVTILSVCAEGIQLWHYVATSISVILGSFLCMWGLRNMPYIGIYADVFFTAIKNLVLLMIAFIPLLIGFSLAVSLMLRGNKGFNELNWNIIKIMSMMLGELNYDEIFSSSDTQAEFRTVAILIIGIFIISVPIVMFNLLLGFTISDVQTLESASEIKVLISTLEQIIVLERVLLSVPAQKLFSKPFLWTFLLERKEWTPECERFGRKCEIRKLMGKLPLKIRERIRGLSRVRAVKVK